MVVLILLVLALVLTVAGPGFGIATYEKTAWSCLLAGSVSWVFVGLAVPLERPPVLLHDSYELTNFVCLYLIACGIAGVAIALITGIRWRMRHKTDLRRDRLQPR